MKCRRSVPYSHTLSDIERRVVPTCGLVCETKAKRGTCGGVFKPNITFFGENIPNKSIKKIEADIEKADALIVIGTSLQVQPVSSIPVRMASGIPQILINRETVRLNKTFEHGGFDFELLGDCDLIIRKLCDDLQWDVAKTMGDWHRAHADQCPKLEGGVSPAPVHAAEVREEGPRGLRFSPRPQSIEAPSKRKTPNESSAA